MLVLFPAPSTPEKDTKTLPLFADDSLLIERPEVYLGWLWKEHRQFRLQSRRALRIARAVPALVVVAQDRGDARQLGALGELGARARVALDRVVLARIEPARLEQHRARHDDLADVVEQACERRLRDGPAVEPGRVGELDRDARDPRGVLGVGGDLRIEPASELEQPREVDALAGPQTDD